MAKKTVAETIAIQPPNMRVLSVLIEGTEPYCQNRFSAKAAEMMKQKQMEGEKAKKGKKREAKDFQECYEQAKHVSVEGWCGIPATAIRTALVSACRLCGFKMTHAKLGVFVLADGSDVVDLTPLIKIIKGEPRYVEHAVRNASGVADIRARPMWEPGWQALVRIRFDADMFTAQDLFNLLQRAGCQVGVGEGRPDSKDSCGMGWGLFKVTNPESEEESKNVA